MFDSEYNFLLLDEFPRGQNIIFWGHLIFAFLPLSFRVKCFCWDKMIPTIKAK